MNSRILKIIFLAVLLVLITVSTASPMMAKQAEKPVLSNPYQESQVITFQDLGFEDFVMFGPFATDQFEFGVPANWKYAQAGQLVLKLKPEFLGSDVPLLSTADDGFIAMLRVFYNDHRVYEVGLNPGQDQEITIPIPIEILNDIQKDGRNKIEFSFLSELSCDYDILASLVIDKTSYISLPYEITPSELDLRNFPRPLYQRDSIVHNSVGIVMPDDPSDEELEAVMAVSAAMGSLTRSNIPLDVFTFSELSQDAAGMHHLIIIGTSARVSSLIQSGFDLPISGSNISAPSFSQDDGVLDLSYSPWDGSKAVLYVGGESDAGVLKASQALGTSSLFVFDDPTYTLIDQVDPFAGESSFAITRSLKDLGYSSSVRSGPNYVSGVGTRFLNYDLYVSPSQINADDGTFFVKYTHSGTMQLGISAMTVQFNTIPIGSQPLTVESASGNASVTFPIPNEYLHIGTNRLTIKVDMIPETQCHIDVSSNLWFAVDESSLIHLPVADISAIEQNRVFDLQAFPESVIQDPTLDGLILIVPENDPTAWKASSKLSALIGDVSRSPIFMPNVVKASNLTEDMLKNKDVILVGLPNNLPLVATLNDYSSVKFDTSTNQAILEGFRVLYRTPLDANLGYIQLIESPWNPNRILMSVLGNSELGLMTAVNALTNPDIQKNVVGNVSLTTEDGAISADTRIGQSPSDLLPTVQPTMLVETQESPVQVPTDFDEPPPFEMPSWLFPVLFVNLGLILVIVVAVIIVSSRRKGA